MAIAFNLVQNSLPLSDELYPKLKGTKVFIHHQSRLFPTVDDRGFPIDPFKFALHLRQRVFPGLVELSTWSFRNSMSADR